MKTGIYKGDLAQVVSADEGRKRVMIKLIPRVDLRAISKKIVILLCPLSVLYLFLAVNDASHF
jgi:hypothetical protein